MKYRLLEDITVYKSGITTVLKENDIVELKEKTATHYIFTCPTIPDFEFEIPMDELSIKVEPVK